MKYADVVDLLSDVERGQSPFQMDRFVTQNHGLTVFGMYRQALRELDVRFRSIRARVLRIAECRCGVEEAEASQSKAADGEGTGSTKHRRASIRLARARCELEDEVRRFPERVREFARFFGQARHLRARLLLDGPLTPERVAREHRAFWSRRLLVEAAEGLLSSRRVPGRVYRLAAAMEDGDRDDLMRRLGRPDELASWFQRGEHLPELGDFDVPNLEPEDVERSILSESVA